MLSKMSNLLSGSVEGVVSCTNWFKRHLGHRDVVSDLRHGIASEEQLKLDLGVVDAGHSIDVRAEAFGGCHCLVGYA